MTGKQLRAAFYVRVSTTSQSVEPQINLLKGVADQRGWNVTGIYADQGMSGAKTKRPRLDALMSACHRGEIDVVAVQRFDRMGRSLEHLVRTLEEFNRLGVQFVSVTESVDTSTSLGRMLYGIIGSLAAFERDIIRERIACGLANAKAKGRRLGRPPQKALDIEKAHRLIGKGTSIKQTAKALGVPRSTLQLALKRGMPECSPNRPA